ncbi:hypothetical protein ACFE04_001106 [Oxalis oulophora]
MLNKIMKLGQKKSGRGDLNDVTSQGSNVTVNHASRNPMPSSTANIPKSASSDSLAGGPSQSNPNQSTNSAPVPANYTIEVLPSLKEVSVVDRPNLFIRKTWLCCCICDFY